MRIVDGVDEDKGQETSRRRPKEGLLASGSLSDSTSTSHYPASAATAKEKLHRLSIVVYNSSTTGDGGGNGLTYSSVNGRRGRE